MLAPVPDAAAVTASDTDPDGLRTFVSAWVSKLAPRYGVPNQDREDLAQDVTLAILQRLCRSVDDVPKPRLLEAYVRACVQNACRASIARFHQDRVRVRDAVVDTLRGYRGVSGLALWEAGRVFVAGAEAWRGQPLVESEGLRLLRERPFEFDDWLERNAISRSVVSLITAIIDLVGGPMLLDELVLHVWELTSPKFADRNEGRWSSAGDSGLDLPDPAPSPEQRAMNREVCAATCVYATGLERARLCAWLLGLDRENLDTLLRACAEPSGWLRRFGDGFAPAVTWAALCEMQATGDLPSAIVERYAGGMGLTVRALCSRLRHLPEPDGEIAGFLGVTAPRVAYFRWCARQEFAAMRERVFAAETRHEFQATGLPAQMSGPQFTHL
jgi:hypothetical protein